MDTNTSAKFISSLTKSLQTILHGCLEFERDIELGGYIYLKVDSLQKVDYVLNEKMQKNAVNSLTFFSNSFHAVPLSNFPEANSSAESRISNSKDSSHHGRHDGFSNSVRQNAEPGSQKSSFSQPQSRQYHGIPFGQHISGDQDSSGHLPFSSDSYFPSNRTRSLDTSGKKVGVSISSRDANLVNVSTPSINSDASNLLVDFQTAFRSPERSFTSSSPSQSSVKKMPPHDENASDNRITACQPQEEKTDILPDSGDMEVIYIKAEDEDEILSIPLHPPGSDITGTDEKPNTLSPLNVNQMPMSIPEMLQQSLSQHQTDNVAHPGWFDPRFQTAILPDPFLQQQQPSPLQGSATPSNTFLGFTQAFSSQSGPRTPSRSSLQSRFHNFTRINCSMCGHVSYTSRAHARHMTIRHSRIGNFVCSQCGKTFQTKLYLAQHMKSHGERQYACEVCGKRFLYKHHLPRHQLAVHGSITFNTSQD